MFMSHITGDLIISGWLELININAHVGSHFLISLLMQSQQEHITLLTSNYIIVLAAATQVTQLTRYIGPMLS